MAGRVPDLKLDLAAFVVLRSVVRVEDSWLVQAREDFLCPGHDHGRLSDGGVAHEDQLHVVFLVLIDQRFCLHHVYIDVYRRSFPSYL